MAPGLVIFIYLIGAGLLIAELFLPGGVTGAVGVVLMASSIVYIFTQFEYGVLIGTGMTLVTVIGLPVIILKAIDRNALKMRASSKEGWVGSQEGLAELAGKEGTALTALRPSGMVQIDGRRVDVVAESGLIPKGAGVRVVKVEGNRVAVRKIADPPADADSFA
jgi:membrane-bound serine protease (ClpP class)